MRLGPYELSSNLFLSPLASYTNLPMRVTVRELGGLGWATTDLVNARSLLERNPTALKLVASSPEDRPMAIQLFGSVPEEMRDAAVMCQELGAQSVDINMGCPVKKVTKIGGGSAMMTELDKTAALVRGMIDAVKIPITAKMRLGWDEENLTAPDLARVLEGVGVAAIFVHGRTRAQGFAGRVNLAGIRSVVAAVKSIPVIGNGDIKTAQDALRMRNETGCAGVMIARGSFGQPWIFTQARALLDGKEMPPTPSVEERFAVAIAHCRMVMEYETDLVGAALEFRKHLGWYVKGLPNSSELRRALHTVNSFDEVEGIFAGYLASGWHREALDSAADATVAAELDAELLEAEH